MFPLLLLTAGSLAWLQRNSAHQHRVPLSTSAPFASFETSWGGCSCWHIIGSTQVGSQGDLQVPAQNTDETWVNMKRKRVRQEGRSVPLGAVPLDKWWQQQVSAGLCQGKVCAVPCCLRGIAADMAVTAYVWQMGSWSESKAGLLCRIDMRHSANNRAEKLKTQLCDFPHLWDLSGQHLFKTALLIILAPRILYWHCIVTVRWYLHSTR